jgi:hypothetical protein
MGYMKPDKIEIEKAENLAAMLTTFRPEPLDEDTLSKFYYDNTMPIRMGNDFSSPMVDLYEDCTMVRSANNAYLFLGHGGCGKSTELYNLKIKLEKEGQPVNIIHCQSVLNLYLAECWDILLIITEGLCEIAQKNGIELPDGLLQEVLNYIKKDIEEIKTKDSSASINIGAVLEFFAFIKGNLQFGTQTRTIIKEKMERRASEWLRYINEISDIITNKMRGKTPILIFEDLDKIQPYEKAFDIFKYDVLAKMPFPIIYTCPISLSYDAKFAYLQSFYNVSVLPMIKVNNDDKKGNKEGIEVIRKIIEYRADLKLFDNDALEELIKQTGGVLRHLFECIITASRLARRREAAKIEIQDAQRALSELSSMLGRRISQEDYGTLEKMYKDPNYRKRIENKEALLRQMQALVVLEYQNGDCWHDLHPLIAKFLIEQGIIDVKN